MTALIQCGGGAPTASPLGQPPLDAPTTCPLEPPTLGAPCDVPPYALYPGVSFPGLCTYGTEQLPQCRQGFECTNAAWEAPLYYLPACTSMAACPSSPPKTNAACSSAIPACMYPETVCTCGNDSNLEQWVCVAPGANPNATDSCPSLIPNAGTACSSEGLQCTYGCLLSADCRSGIWIWDETPCG